MKIVHKSRQALSLSIEDLTELKSFMSQSQIVQIILDLLIRDFVLGDFCQIKENVKYLTTCKEKKHGTHFRCI